MKKQTLFNLASMPKMVLIITLVVMLGSLFGATSYLLKTPKTDLPIVNPVVEAQCKIDSDCSLVAVGGACTPCSTSDEGYQCLPKKEAAKIERERQKILNDPEGPLCSLCMPLFEIQHICKCENGKCEKVKEELVEEVIIATDKMEYEQGEEIKVAISDADNPFYVPFSFGANSTTISFYQLKENAWKILTQHCETDCIEICENGVLNFTPCILYSRPEYDYYKYEGPWEFQWNQKECVYKDSLCDKESYKEGLLKQVSYGKFKVEFCYFDEEDVDPTNMPGYAAPDKKKCVESEFTIKEKSALDSRCGEKVKGIGPCDAYRKGYEFNLETGKCIRKGVSGCSFEIPFKTLEECQEVCEKSDISKIGSYLTFLMSKKGLQEQYSVDIEFSIKPSDEKLTEIENNYNLTFNRLPNGNIAHTIQFYGAKISGYAINQLSKRSDVIRIESLEKPVSN